MQRPPRGLGQSSSALMYVVVFVAIMFMHEGPTQVYYAPYPTLDECARVAATWANQVDEYAASLGVKRLAWRCDAISIDPRAA